MQSYWLLKQVGYIFTTRLYKVNFVSDIRHILQDACCLYKYRFLLTYTVFFLKSFSIVHKIQQNNIHTFTMFVTAD
jgi:hypothetical protein